LLAIAALILAICFRFAYLDRKVYWHDEAYTSTVITARPGRYFTEELFQNKLAKPADLLAYQQFVPELTFTDMLVRKGMEDVQHPPIYYVLLRFWAQLWGTDVAVVRGFSALLSLLVLPAAYWLGLELFESRLGGWVALALFAVSPFHLVFGQEAREYGFWTALILISSAALLRAIRSPTWGNWALYGAAMLVAFYTAMLSLWIAIGHFAYILVIDPDNRYLKRPWQIGKRTTASVATLLVVAFLYLPWVYFVIAARQAMGSSTSWTSIPLPKLISLQASAFNFSRSFVDFNFDFDNPLAYVLIIPLLILQIYALYVLCRTAPRRVWWFVLTFGGCTALALWLPDLLFGGQLFTVTRYLIPCFVATQLTVVYFLTTYLTVPQRWKSRLAMLVFSLLMALGIVSCGVYTQSNTWWNKVLNSNYHQVAALINQSNRPLIIVDPYTYNAASMISLSYLLNPDTQFLLLPRVGNSFPVKNLPPGKQTIFLFNLPEVFRQQFEARYQTKLTLAFQDPWNEVWQTHSLLTP
jgi:uncharacterized membrane protein